MDSWRFERRPFRCSVAEVEPLSGFVEVREAALQMQRRGGEPEVGAEQPVDRVPHEQADGGDHHRFDPRLEHEFVDAAGRGQLSWESAVAGMHDHAPVSILPVKQNPPTKNPEEPWLQPRVGES